MKNETASSAFPWLFGSLTILFLLSSACAQDSEDEVEGQSKGIVEVVAPVVKAEACDISLQASADENAHAGEVVVRPDSVEYGGIGLTLDTSLQVVDVMPGFPAELAGIEVGDFVTSIEGAPITESDAGRVASEIRGPAGSTVVLGFMRAGLEERTVALERVLIVTPRHSRTHHYGESPRTTGSISITDVHTTGCWNPRDGDSAEDLVERAVLSHGPWIAACLPSPQEGETGDPQTLTVEALIGHGSSTLRMNLLNTTIIDREVLHCFMREVTHFAPQLTDRARDASARFTLTLVAQ